MSYSHLEYVCSDPKSTAVLASRTLPWVPVLPCLAVHHDTIKYVCRQAQINIARRRAGLKTPAMGTPALGVGEGGRRPHTGGTWGATPGMTQVRACVCLCVCV